MKKNVVPSAFTLLELAIVMLVVATLTSLGAPVYVRAMERAKDYEARTNLMLIQAAERIYRNDNGAFYPLIPPNPETAVGNINNFLRLNMNENQWDYIVTSSVAPDHFTAMANKKLPDGGFHRDYDITDTDTEPSCYDGTPP